MIKFLKEMIYMYESVEVYTLILKNQLINMDVEQSQDVYKEDMNFIFLLPSIKMIIENEPEFFLVEKTIIPKVYEIINKNRLDRGNVYVNEINEIIVNINKIDSLSEEQKFQRLTQYITKQIKTRRINYNIDKEMFTTAISYDYLVYKLLNGNDDIVIPVNYICSSINYILDFLPEMFENNDVIENCDILMDTSLIILEESKEISRREKITLKNNVLDTKQKLEETIKTNQKIKMKGE